MGAWRGYPGGGWRWDCRPYAARLKWPLSLATAVAVAAAVVAAALTGESMSSRYRR